MGQLAFLEEDILFDGKCVRFKGDGQRQVLCGVTIVGLKEGDPSLQRHGLVPAETFLSSFQKLMIPIHDATRAKYKPRRVRSRR